MAEYLDAVDRFGVAVTLLIAIGVTAWRVVKWLAPRVDKVVDSHVSFVSKVGDQVERQTDCMIVMSRGVEANGNKLDEIHKKLIRG